MSAGEQNRQTTRHPLPSSVATAPGKIILVGEHAVVYGRPALAVPVTQVTARAVIRPGVPGSGVVIHAPQIEETIALHLAPAQDPLALVTRLALEEAGVTSAPDWAVEVSSTIPMASGLGSGAAICTALVRAVFQQSNHPQDPAVISRLVFAAEEIFHGTPSGIDNTVVAYATPIWFVKGTQPRPIYPRASFTIAIADSGIPALTKESVGDVRRGYQMEPARYSAIFDRVGALVEEAKAAIERGDAAALGPIFDANQQLLTTLDVSSPVLERLIRAARDAGAGGAKLSGGGRGGNVIALVTPESAPAVATALTTAGARRVIVTTVAAADRT